MGGGRDKNGVAIYRRRNGAYERLDGKPINRKTAESEFRRQINETKTNKEFGNVMIARYGKNNVKPSFLKKDLGMLKKVMSTIDDLESKYPEMKGKVHTFTGRNASALSSMNIDGSLNINDVWSTLDNPRLYNDNDGWSYKNTTPESIIAHEFAHAIESKLIEKMYPDAFKNGEIDTSAGLALELQARSAWSTDSVLFDARDRALSRLGYTSVQQASSTISKYAETSLGELFAEAFGDVYSNGDKASNASKVFTEELIKELRR